jgi:hypothetical protein
MQRNRLSKFVGRAAQYGDLPRRRLGRQRVDQRRLADAWFALQPHHPTGATGQPVNHIQQRAALAVATHQEVPCRCGNHVSVPSRAAARTWRLGRRAR